MDSSRAALRPTSWDDYARPSHGAHETNGARTRQPPFPSMTTNAPVESGFPDWRARLARNLARRSDGRWEPLTWVHAETVTLAKRSQP